MADSFDAGVDELKERVGHGALKGKLESDQVYSRYQHERADLNHPNGGQAFFILTALHSGGTMQSIADAILEGGGVAAMTDAVEQLDKDAAALTPKETTVLARSGHPTVYDNGALVYDRPPEVPRLSEEELRAIHRRGVTIRRAPRTT